MISQMLLRGVAVAIIFYSTFSAALVPLGSLNNRLIPINNKKPPNVMCTADSLMIYQDCRMCVCPRPNRNAKCFKKSCDLRTKDGGQCPPAFLKMDDSKLCGSGGAQCKVDADCPNEQLCCFDFCTGGKCINGVPLDASSGIPHNGRGYVDTN